MASFTVSGSCRSRSSTFSTTMPRGATWRHVLQYLARNGLAGIRVQR
jgi:hypothetical protein